MTSPDLLEFLGATGGLVRSFEAENEQLGGKSARCAVAVADVLNASFLLVAAALEAHPEEPILFDAWVFLAERLGVAQARVESLNATFH